MKSFAAFLALSITAGFSAAAEPADPDIALEPAHIIVNPWRFHISPTKRQGVPGIERTAKGRLWVIHGRDVESPRNYQVLIRSDSNGRRWSHPKLMILPREGVRAMSAAIWIDPTGRMWAFWGQSFGQQDGRYGIWAITTDDPDAEDPKWSRPRRLGDGIMLNKPTVLSNGDWLFTSSVWKADHSIKVYATTDQGKTFKLRGTVNVLPPETRGPDEPMIVERKDGSLWMLVRRQGMTETVSHDSGKTWSTVKQSSLRHPTARFFLRRLKSGALLLVKHGPLDERVGRTDLMAFVSDDDGQTWQGGLMLDDREKVTYPDGVQSRDGTIYIVYDHNRTPDGEVLMATLTEDDARAGKPVTEEARLRVVVARLRDKTDSLGEQEQ